MAVLKTTSPVVLPFAPTETPRNTVPSSRASTAGVDTPVPRFALRRLPQMRKAGGAPSERPPASWVDRDQFPGANINGAGDDCPSKVQERPACHTGPRAAPPAIPPPAVRPART